MTAAARPRRNEPPRPPLWSRRTSGVRFGTTFAVLVAMIMSTLIAAPTYALFSGTTTNPAASFTGAASFPTYSASVTGDSAWSFHREEESPSSAATLAATDSSGNARAGAYNGITNGPVAYWKLEEGTGSTAIDSSGAANPGTPANSPTTTTGKVGNALSFNGTTQYLTGARAAVNTTTSFSVSAWVYLTANGTHYTAVAQDGTNIAGYQLTYDDNFDRWAFTVRRSDSTGATADVALSAGTPTLNTWTHLTGVYDDVADNIKLYLNGSLVATTAHPTTWNATGQLTVGRSKWSGSNVDFWSGRIDDVRLYQRALTAAEVLAIGNGLPFTDWEFTEGTNSTIADRGTNTLNGATVGGGGWTTSGHDGNAFVFDGTDDRVTASPPALNTSTSYTVSAWVYLTSKADAGSRTAVCQNGANVCAYWLQYDKGNDRWAFTVSNADSTGSSYPRALSTSSPSTNTWYHLTGVHDSVGDTIKLYVNGTLQNTTAYSSGWNSTTTFGVGRALWGGQNEFWIGNIDTVKAWQRVLSATEITDQYNGVGYTETDMTAGLTGALQGAQQGQTTTTAVAFTGLSNGYVDTSVSNPTTFSIECWFRSSSSTGGVIMGFGGQKTGVSANRDRLVYLDSGGNVTFGVAPGGVKATIRSTATYNDGAWHHVTATLGAAGMKLYLDGDLVASDAATTSAQNFTGYWRWGGEGMGAWANVPSTTFLTGAIDEVAVYTTQLTDQKVARHYAANH